MVGQFWQMYSDDGIYWNVYPKDTEFVPVRHPRTSRYGTTGSAGTSATAAPETR